MKKERLYKADWFRYVTGNGKLQIRNYNTPEGDKGPLLEVENVLVRESEIPFYQQYGGGIKKLEFVAYIRIPEDTIDLQQQFLQSGEVNSMKIKLSPIGDIANMDIKL